MPPSRSFCLPRTFARLKKVKTEQNRDSMHKWNYQWKYWKQWQQNEVTRFDEITENEKKNNNDEMIEGKQWIYPWNRVVFPLGKSVESFTTTHSNGAHSSQRKSMRLVVRSTWLSQQNDRQYILIALRRMRVSVWCSSLCSFGCCTIMSCSPILSLSDLTPPTRSL